MIPPVWSGECIELDVSAGVGKYREYREFQFPRLNSVSFCRRVCQRYRYQLAGVSDSTSCHCTNNIPAQIVRMLEPSAYASVCPGNPAEICGGEGRLGVYMTGTVSASSVIN